MGSTLLVSDKRSVALDELLNGSYSGTDACSEHNANMKVNKLQPWQSLAILGISPVEKTPFL